MMLQVFTCNNSGQAAKLHPDRFTIFDWKKYMNIWNSYVKYEFFWIKSIYTYIQNFPQRTVLFVRVRYILTCLIM